MFLMESNQKTFLQMAENQLGCDIGGAKEPGVIYFPTNWGAKEPHNLPNHRVVKKLVSVVFLSLISGVIFFSLLTSTYNLVKLGLS